MMDPHPAESPREHGAPTTLSGYRILLVEDNWIVAQSLKSILEVIGATVIGPAATLDDATALADAAGFDVAIMDLDLQGRMADGLIAEMHHRDMPVVIVTAYVVPAALAGKAVAVLPKPVRAESLLTRLRQIRADAGAGR